MLATEIRTASDLRAFVEASGKSPFFFDRQTMRVWGDTMANYGVRKTTIETYDGPLQVWELFRHRPVKNGLQSSAYFCCDTFARRWPKA